MSSKVKRAPRLVAQWFAALGREAAVQLMTLWFFTRDPTVAWWDKLIAVGALSYFVTPVDAMPDPIFIDDVAVVAMALERLNMVVTDEHRAQGEQWVARRMGRATVAQ